MRHFFTFAALTVAVVLAGCGKPTHESLTDDMIDEMNDLTDVLKTVKDEASAKAAKPKIVAIAKNMEELAKKGKELGEPSKEIQQKLSKQVEEPAKKMMAEFMRISMDEKLSAALEDAMKEFEKIRD